LTEESQSFGCLKNLIELFDLFLFRHVAHPNEKGNKTDYDQQFIKPWTHPVHDLKYSLKKIRDEIPDAVHNLKFLVLQK
jgi:hypothetical protein